MAGAQRWPWVKGEHEKWERRRCGISELLYDPQAEFTFSIDVVEPEIFIMSCYQSNDATPRALI